MIVKGKTTSQQKKAKKTELKKMKQLIRDMETTVRVISKLVKENGNTKREIKEAVSRLRCNSSLLNTVDMWDLINTLKTPSMETGKSISIAIIEKEIGTQTESTHAREITTQTDYTELSRNKEYKSVSCQTEPQAGDALTKLLESENLSDMLDIVKQKWNEKCYPKTRPGLGSPLESDRNTIFLVDTEESVNSWWKQKLAETYPQIKPFLKDGKPSEGKTIRVCTNVNVVRKITKENKKKPSTCWVLKVHRKTKIIR